MNPQQTQLKLGRRESLGYLRTRGARGPTFGLSLILKRDKQEHRSWKLSGSGVAFRFTSRITAIYSSSSDVYIISSSSSWSVSDIPVTSSSSSKCPNFNLYRGVTFLLVSTASGTFFTEHFFKELCKAFCDDAVAIRRM
jgi:hypothetical protein